MGIERKNLIFLFLGALIAISLEQFLWWDLIISQKTVHNDFWILISEDVKSYQEGSKLDVLYSTDINQANLVLNIWKILVVIPVIGLGVLILRTR
ncbi:MAG: hypothetical protein J4452_01810 [Candidatus Aenigmarchaeota archaeon]|nr:hypothetical protein [Candidatus Aenigmarchaeota archaeon]